MLQRTSGACELELSDAAARLRDRIELLFLSCFFFGWDSVAGPSKEAGDTADPDPDHILRDRKT